MVEATLYPDWREKVVYSAEGPKPQVLVESGGFLVILGALEPGAKIPLHPEGLAVHYFLEGTGWMLVDDQRLAVKAGATVIVPAGARRGIEAETRLAWLAARIA